MKPLPIHSSSTPPTVNALLACLLDLKLKGCGDSVLIVDSDPKSEVPARILDRLRVTSTHVFLMPGQRFGE